MSSDEAEEADEQSSWTKVGPLRHSDTQPTVINKSRLFSWALIAVIVAGVRLVPRPVLAGLPVYPFDSRSSDAPHLRVVS